MSADNWTRCPRCDKRENDIKHNLYGKVPEEDYLAAVNEIKKAKTEENLREDYDIGVFRNTFSVNYVCHCDKCGYHFEYEFGKELEIGE